MCPGKAQRLVLNRRIKYIFSDPKEIAVATILRTRINTHIVFRRNSPLKQSSLLTADNEEAIVKTLMSNKILGLLEKDLQRQFVFYNFPAE